MSNKGLTKFKIVPRSLSSGPSQGIKLGSLVQDAEIYNPGTNDLSDVYSDDKATAISNPITAVDGTITFYSYMPELDVKVNLTNGATIIRSAIDATTTHTFIYDTSISTGSTVEAAGQTNANIVKTLSWTLGVSNATGVDYNFNMDDISFFPENPFNNPSVEGDIENEIEIVDALPAYCKIIDLSVINIETADDTIFIKVGNSRAGSNIHTYTKLSETGTHIDYAASSLGTLDSINGKASIFVTADPSQLWEDIITGKWRLSVTYIDYGQLI